MYIATLWWVAILGEVANFRGWPTTRGPSLANRLSARLLSQSALLLGGTSSSRSYVILHD
jgi:hypothetical protein